MSAVGDRAAGGATGEAPDAEEVPDLVAWMLALPPADRAWVWLGLPEKVRHEWSTRWANWAHEGQTEPEEPWRLWLIRAGRGFGKTRAGAEWVSQFVRDHGRVSIALVGHTADDVAKVMVEGSSGLLAVARLREVPVWSRIKGEVHWPNGAVAHVYSANAPEKLRGPEHHAAWCDELGKWPVTRGRGSAAWDNMMLGLRAGERPRVIVTTTPRANPLMRKVMGMKGKAETRGRSRDNLHLPQVFIEEMEEQYGGTRLGRQELDGEMIDDVAGALWSRETIEACRSDVVVEPVRVVVGVDPPASAGGDACGIVAAAIDGDGIVHVLEDASVSGEAPDGWARAVVACVARHRADRVVAESNQGGDMVVSVLSAADRSLPVVKAHAARGKSARAEPVALLYGKRLVRHVGRFPELEDELCGLVARGGYEGPGRSPDRADALVWAVSELVWGTKGEASVRGLG